MRAFLQRRAAAGGLHGRDLFVGSTRRTATTTIKRRVATKGDDADTLPPWPPGDAPLDADAALLARSASLPVSFYSGAAALERDLSRVFAPGAWTYAGPAAWVAKPGDYFTLGGGDGGAAWPPPTVVVRSSADAPPRAFFNVCRHRAAPVAAGPRGSCLTTDGRECVLTCGYHGWQYRATDGRLASAPRMGKVERLGAARIALAPMATEVVGPLVFVRPGRAGDEAEGDGLDGWLGTEGAAAVRAVVRGDYDPTSPPQQQQPSASTPSLVPVARREWRLACDWKVFADNYLDGGYHVSVAHPKLAAGIDLETYVSRLHGERVSVQSVRSRGAGDEKQPRLGARSAYVWVYPNVAINRYGPWLDVNVVVPDAKRPGHCRVLFDWFLDASELSGEEAMALSSSPSPSFQEHLRRLPPRIADALRDSCAVQEEDVQLCESVQRGIEAAARFPDAFGSLHALLASAGGGANEEEEQIGGGRYGKLELPMFAYHRALWADYKRKEK